ncbi:MAG: NfeD family protein [Spirochaetaceae bacterium]|nr:NfeD family protein [Spirochaetaceae bacterium]
MGLLLEYLPWFWLFLMILFTAIEVATFGLTTIWFALGALVMLFLSPLPIPFLWQILLFLIISSVLLIFTRPIAVKKLKVGREKTNTDSLIGEKALVIKEITEFEKGLVKIRGIEWSAQSIDGKPIAKDETCIVERIEGVTVVVGRGVLEEDQVVATTE